MKLVQRSFASGEISPRLFGLSQSDQYVTGCLSLGNAFIARLGSIIKRGGFKYLMDSDDGRIFPWSVRGDSGYFVYIAASSGAITVYDVETLSATVLSGVTAPWAAADLPDVDYTATSNSLIFSHGSYEPREISRDTDGSFRFGIFDTGTNVPLLPVRSKTITMKFTDENTLTSSEDVFTKDDFTNEGGASIFCLHSKDGEFYCRVDGYTSPRIVNVTPFGSASSGNVAETVDWTGPWKPVGGVVTTDFAMKAGDPSRVVGSVFDIVAPEADMALNGLIVDFDYTTNPGDRMAHFHYNVTGNDWQCKMINGTATPAAPHTFSDHQVYELFDFQTPRDNVCLVVHGAANVVFDLFAQAYTPAGESSRVVHKVFNALMAAGGTERAGHISFNGGIGRVSTYYDESRIRVTVDQKPVMHGPTTSWGLGWSRGTGYPSCVTVHQNRVAFGGYEIAPGLVTLSRTGAYRDFKAGADDDSSVQLEIVDVSIGKVNWMASAGDLLVGTDTAEFAISGQPLTPTKFGVDRQSTYGGSSVKSTQVGAAVLFVTRIRSSIREMAFRFESDKYHAPDLTDIADHLFDSDIKRIVYLREPEQLVLVLTDAGDLYCMTYRREAAVLAFSKWPIGGVVKDIGISQGESTEKVWILIKRTVNSSDFYYIEELTFDVPKSDSWVAYDFGAGAVAPGGTFDNMANETVQVWRLDSGSQSGYMGPVTVEVDGSVELTGVGGSTISEFGNCVLGYGYSLAYKPVPLELDDTPGQRRSITKIKLLVENTAGLKLDEIFLGDQDQKLEEDWDRSEWIEASGAEGSGEIPDLAFTQEFPYDTQIVAIVTEVEHEG